MANSCNDLCKSRKNRIIAQHYLSMHKHLANETGIVLEPATVAYADQDYGKKNSNMDTNASIRSITNFWENVAPSLDNIPLNLYISGVVGVTSDSRQGDGIINAIETTSMIQRTLGELGIDANYIWGDTAGQMTPNDAKLMVNYCPLPSPPELHLHHSPEINLMDDFTRRESVLRVFSKEHPLILHIGIFGGGSPFCGVSGGFGGNLWLPFVCSLGLRSNLTVSTHPTKNDMIRLLAQALDGFMRHSPQPSKENEQMINDLVSWNIKNPAQFPPLGNAFPHVPPTD